MLSTFLFFCRSLGFYGGMTSLLFLRVGSRRLRSALVYALGSANTLRRASCAVLPVLRRKETPRRRRVVHVSDILLGRERKLTFRALSQIDIPTSDTAN